MNMQERPKGEGAGKTPRRGERGKENNIRSPLLKVVTEIVHAAGVFEQFQNVTSSKTFHLRLEQEAYEPLVIEAFPASISFMGEKRHISVAHYYTQDHDPIADPDLLMTDTGHPIEITMPNYYSRILRKDPQRGTMVDTRAKKDLEEFMRVWARNLREQGWIEAAREYKKQHEQNSEMNNPEL